MLDSPLIPLPVYDNIPLAVNAAIVEVIQKDEGGWVLTSDPDGGDGGWTYGGMTTKTFAVYFGYTNKAEIRALLGTPDETKLRQTIVCIYYQSYYVHIAPTLKATAFAPMHLSCVINCGVAGFDAIMSDVWNRKVSFLTAWKDRYINICHINPDKRIFLTGWINRLWRYIPNV